MTQRGRERVVIEVFFLLLQKSCLCQCAHMIPLYSILFSHLNKIKQKKTYSFIENKMMLLFVYVITQFFFCFRCQMMNWLLNGKNTACSLQLVWNWHCTFMMSEKKKNRCKWEKLIMPSVKYFFLKNKTRIHAHMFDAVQIIVKVISIHCRMLNNGFFLFPLECFSFDRNERVCTQLRHIHLSNVAFMNTTRASANHIMFTLARINNNHTISCMCVHDARTNCAYQPSNRSAQWRRTIGHGTFTNAKAKESFLFLFNDQKRTSFSWTTEEEKNYHQQTVFFSSTEKKIVQINLFLIQFCMHTRSQHSNITRQNQWICNKISFTIHFNHLNLIWMESFYFNFTKKKTIKLNRA